VKWDEAAGRQPKAVLLLLLVGRSLGEVHARAN
jgi:hypothetical protein